MTSTVLIPSLPGLLAVRADACYVNVRDRRAAGDGKADDGAVIQAAIDSLPKRTGGVNFYGGTVYLPAGTYRIGKPLVVSDGVNLLGEHLTRTRLVAAAGLKGPMLVVQGEHARVDNLDLAGQAAGILWKGGSGASLVNVRVQAARRPLELAPGSCGMISNVVLRGGQYGLTADRPGSMTLTGIAIEGSSTGGILLAGGGPLTIQGLTCRSAGRGASIRRGCAAAIIGASFSGDSGEAIACDKRSLVHVSAISAPGYALLLHDESGEEARLTGPTLGLYTGQATVLSATSADLKPRKQVRVNCGGGDIGAFEADFGFSASACRYGNDLNPREVDLSHIPQDSAPRQVYLTERSGQTVEYIFPMVPGKYRVRLHLCEVFFEKPNQRVFRVEVNGKEVVSKIDLILETGKKFCPVVREVVEIEPLDGKIRIFLDGLEVPRFIDLNAGLPPNVKTNPTVCGIEILPMTGGVK